MNNNFLYKFLRIIFKPIFLFYYNPKIINKRVIPKTKAFIVCGNHLDFKDQFPVIMSTNRVIHWLAKKEHFDGSFGFFYKKTGCISVDRNAHDGKAKKKALKYLRKDEAIGIFPEGTRNKTTMELLDFKLGAVKMAQELNVPLIPFAITGKFKFRSKDLTLRFGRPMYVSKEEDIIKANEKLRMEVLKLQRKNKNMR